MLDPEEYSSVGTPLDFGFDAGNDPGLGPFLSCLTPGHPILTVLGSAHRESGGNDLSEVGIASGFSVENSGLTLAGRILGVLPLSSQVSEGVG